MQFDFEAVAHESNEEVMARVLAFIRENRDAVERFNGGSVFHGTKSKGKPNGLGFMASFAGGADTESLE